jgi:hypothetical protein
MRRTLPLQRYPSSSRVNSGPSSSLRSEESLLCARLSSLAKHARLVVGFSSCGLSFEHGSAHRVFAGVGHGPKLLELWSRRLSHNTRRHFINWTTLIPCVLPGLSRRVLSSLTHSFVPKVFQKLLLTMKMRSCIDRGGSTCTSCAPDYGFMNSRRYPSRTTTTTPP